MIRIETEAEGQARRDAFDRKIETFNKQLAKQERRADILMGVTIGTIIMFAVVVVMI